MTLSPFLFSEPQWCFFCWAYSFLIMFWLCYFLLCSEWSYVSYPSLLCSLKSGNAKSIGLSFYLPSAKYFTIWISYSIIYQSHWSPQFNICVVRHVVFLLWKSKRQGTAIIHFSCLWPHKFQISLFPLTFSSCWFTNVFLSVMKFNNL